MGIKRNILTSVSEDLEKRFGPLTIARIVRAFRQCDEISQANYAKKLGISKANLCDIEKGRKKVSFKRAAQFAKKMGLPPEYLITVAIEESLRDAKLKYRVELKSA